MFLFLILFVSLAGVVATPTSVRFPGSTQPYVSADGRFEVLWEKARGDLPHRLFLRNRSDQSQRELLRFNRHIEAFWSPDGATLMVTDYDGSDHANTFIFSANGGFSIDIDARFRQLDSIPKSIFNNHHLYIEGRGWTSPKRVRIKVWGYGDTNPKGFQLLLECDVDGENLILKQFTRTLSHPE